MTRKGQKDDKQQRCCFIYSNSDDFMKVVPQKKTPRSLQTSVLNENGEWVSISSTATTSTTATDSDEDNDDDDLSVVDDQSDGSSVQFDENGRPISYNSMFDCDNNDNDIVVDMNEENDDDNYETKKDEDEHDEDESVETAPTTTHDADDDSCNSSRIVGFDEKAYAARIEAEIAKEEDLAAGRLKVRTEKQRIARERSQMEQQQQRERKESLMASKKREAQRLAEAAADLERIAIQAEKELAEAECIATAAEAAHEAMVSASVAKSVNQRIETMKRNPIQISRISKIASQQESESFENTKSKVQRDVAEMVESERLSSEYKQMKWVSQTSEEERLEAEKARNWGHNPLEGMSPSRGRGSPKKSSSLPSVSNNRKNQRRRPKKSQSLQEGKGEWVSVSL